MDVFARYIVHHPEIFAVLLGWFFASGETWFGSRLYPSSWKKSKRKTVSLLHSTLASFIWIFVLWRILDYRHDDSYFVVGLVSFGCAICIQMVQEVIIAFLNARLQHISGDKSQPGIFKTMFTMFKSKPK